MDDDWLAALGWWVGGWKAAVESIDEHIDSMLCADVSAYLPSLGANKLMSRSNTLLPASPLLLPACLPAYLPIILFTS